MANTLNAKNATIELFGPVDGFWGVGLESLTRNLKQNNGEDLEILINSPGGDVFEGIAMGEMLTRRSGNTTTTAIGLAASIATVVLMAGDTVQMAESATLMIHDAWAFEAGDAETMQKTAETLDKLSDTIAGIYTNQIAKTGKLIDGDKDKTREYVREMMKAEKWLNAQEALDLGLIDQIVANSPELEEIDLVGTQNSDTDAKFRACLKSYKNTPNNILSKYNNDMSKDKKSLWQSIKAYFAPEIKAEIEAAQEPATEEPTTTEDQNNEEMTMTIEEMKEALAKEGFEVSAKEVEQPKEETKEDPQAAILARFEKLEADNAKLREEIKAQKFAASAKSAGGKGEESKEDSNAPKLSKEQKGAFSSLAELIKK